MGYNPIIIINIFGRLSLSAKYVIISYFKLKARGTFLLHRKYKNKESCYHICLS